VPFRSKKQARLMFAKHPKIAKRWVKESKRKGKKHPIKSLPTYKACAKGAAGKACRARKRKR
jgi:hypothetical protein